MKIEIQHIARSGGHAIVNWLCGHFDDIVFFNDVQRYGNSRPRKGIYFGDEKNVKNFIWNYENVKPNLNLIEPHISRVNNSTPKYKVLLIRDPLNLLASQIKAGPLSIKMDIYNNYLNIMLDKTNKDFIIINYNMWFKSYDYRRKLEETLKLPFSDKFLVKVSQFGGGSSFDKQLFDGDAQKMNVLNRWEEYKDHPQILKILQNEKMIQILNDEFEIKIK